MNTRIFLLLHFLLIAPLTLSAQSSWHSLASPIRGVDLSDDGERIVAVGDFGSILFSIDSGETWHRSFADSYERFEDVLLRVDGSVVIAGTEGFLAVSDTAVEEWERIPIGEGAGTDLWKVRSVGSGPQITVLGDSLLLMVNPSDGGVRSLELPGGGRTTGVFFTSENRGVAAVEGTGIYHTADGGESWNVSLSDSELRDGDVAGSTDGTVLAASSLNGRLYLSTDSGKSWRNDLPSAPLRPLRIDVGGTGYVAVAGYPQQEGKRGNTLARFSLESESWEWGRVQYSSGSNYSTDVAVESDGAAFAGGDLGALSFVRDSSAEVYVHEPNPGGGQFNDIASAADSIGFSAVFFGPVMKTINRGTTWGDSFGGASISGIGFPRPDCGLLFVQTARRIYRTYDTGYSYQGSSVLLSENIASNFTNVSYMSEVSSAGEAVAIVAEDFNPDLPVYLLRTDDTLHSFEGENIEDSGFVFRSADLDHQCLGFVLTYSRALDTNGNWTIRLRRVEDYGRHQELITEVPSRHIDDWHVWVASCDRVYRAVQLDDTAHMLMESTDRGETWHDFYRFDGPVQLSFLTDSVWIAGSNHGRIWISYDAGASWELERIDPEPVVHFETTGFTYYPQFIEAILLDDSATILLRGAFGLLFRKDIERITTGVEDRVDEKRGRGVLSVIPSVTDGRVRVSWRGEEGRRILLFDMAGEQRGEWELGSGATSRQISVAGLPVGYYQLVLIDGAGEWIATTRLLRQ